MTTEELTQAVIVTGEVIGHEVKPVVALAIAKSLADYEPAKVLAALERCQRELAGRLTLAAILDRIEDGHIGADEAWALCPRSEAETVVWTDEIASAFEAAKSLLDEGDIIAARMAFRDHYGKAVAAARTARREASWQVSLGHDKGGRIVPLKRAVALGRLTAEDALKQASPELPGYQALAALAAPQEARALPRSPMADHDNPALLALLDAAGKEPPHGKR